MESRRGDRAGPPRALADVLADLKRLGRSEHLLGRARFGISDATGFGVAVPDLRRLARPLRRDHDLAQKLWASGSLDARMLAAMIDDPACVTPTQMDRWASAFNSWALCDGCCQDLFVRTPYALAKALEWSRRPEEYVKRAGFALMAQVAVHREDVGAAAFRHFLQRIEGEAGDDRLYVRKGVNWALRQIGKRSSVLHTAAVASAKRIARLPGRSARWIASDALRELRSPEVGARLRERATRRPATSRPARSGSRARATRSAARSSPSSRSRRRAVPR